MDTLRGLVNNRNILYLFFGLSASLLQSIVIVQIFAVLIFAAYLIDNRASKKEALDIFTIFILLLGFVRFLSVIFSEYIDASLPTIPREILFYTTAVSLSYFFKLFNEDEINKAVRGFIIIGVLTAVIGYLQFSFGVVARAQSFGSGYSTFSTYLLVVVVMLLFTYKKNFKNIDILLWSLAIGFVTTGIITALGRTNMAICAVMLLAGLVIKRVNYKAILGIAFFVFAFSAAAFQANSGELDKRLEKPASMSDRDIILQSFLSLADDHPITGYGPLTFHEIFPMKEQLADKKVGSWHNDYIQMYIESGVVSLLIFIILNALLVVRGYLAIRRSNENKHFMWMLLLSVLALLMAAVTGTFIFSPILSLVYAFIAALSSAKLFPVTSKA